MLPRQPLRFVLADDPGAGKTIMAVLYERDAQRVILTPGGSDHGCDVVVLGGGPQREDLLIQCKATREMN